MNRQFYLDLAAQGHRMPIGADLVLRRKSDPDAILLDAGRLGRVLMEAADHYRTPLALPIMDLMLEKAYMLNLLGITENVDSYHFSANPVGMFSMLDEGLKRPLPARMQANCQAIAEIVRVGRHVPIGMSIGPVSLMTKLLADPITPIYMAGDGIAATEDDEVATIETVLEMSIRVVLRSIEAQIHAGAAAIFVAEPAANQAYFSPMQLDAGADVWQRYVMGANRRVKALLDQHGVDLFFHCCGELVDPMVRDFASLDPALLSLGSSRQLWHDATLVGPTNILYGNLPTKKFYSDSAISPEQVIDLTHSLAAEMKKTNHPFILGSECDVLSVPGCEHTICRKIDLMLGC